jgi:trans-2,3-dihydro-3-hydroxyanthranilate isomerase
MSGTSVRLSWLDVFTDRPFAGNPLAVVHDADDLDDERMQTIARELGLSETVFVLEDAARLRIFTLVSEVPLAGHPVVGASVELARLGRIPADGAHVFRTGAGETPVSMAGGVATMTQAAFDAGRVVDAEVLAPLLGLTAADVLRPPRVCTTSGIWHAFVQVRDRGALREIMPDTAAIARFDADGVAPWCEVAEGKLAQRFIAPRMGIPEDPATGAASGALGALRVFEGGEPGSLTISQGEEIGRPSEISVTIGGAPGAPDEVRVGGRAVLVMEGELRL